MTAPKTKSLKVFAALDVNMESGFVWLDKPELLPRSIVKITNGRHSVYCEAIQIDDNFLRNYNLSPRFTISNPSSSIVVCGWYRARLGGIETQQDYPLEIVAANSWWGKLRACFDHPQIVIRVAAMLGVWSVALGVIGVLLGMIGIYISNHS